MSLFADMRPLLPPSGAPLSRVGYQGKAWIGDVLPLRSDAFERYPLLSGIDPYGYTVFNSVQMPFVVAELERRQGEFAGAPEGSRDAEFIAELLAFARECECSHKALFFIGD